LSTTTGKFLTNASILLSKFAQNGAIAGDKIVFNGSVWETRSDITYNAEDVAATTNASTTVYATKVTLVTPSLPLGDYMISWSLKWTAANANRGIKVGIFVNGTEIVNQINFSASVADYPMIGGRKKQSAISGIKTIDIKFLSGIGATTITTSEALLTIQRVG
jgi:hypothetical protein